MKLADVPEHLKQHNWILYVLARSDNPVERVLKTRDLISSLITTMKMAKETTHDQFLVRLAANVNEAWVKLNDGEVGAAVQDCQTALDQIGFLIYDEKYSTSQSDLFTNVGGT